MITKRGKNYFVAILLIITLILVLYKMERNNDSLELNGYYTTGKILETYPVRGYFNVKFIYTVNNTDFIKINKISKIDSTLIGKNFIVKFSPDNPKNAMILLNYPITDSSRIIPKSVWKILPKEKLEISRYDN